MALMISSALSRGLDRLPAAMHIPDGFLNVPVSIALWSIAVLFIGLALHQTRRELGERMVPLMGVLGAFIFAAQAINFPIAAGTSGHLVGAALAAVLLGPWPALLVMACVLGVQGLLFQDGGLLAMGGNIVNMAVLATLLAGSIYRGAVRLFGGTRSARMGAGFLSAWIAVVVGSMAAAFELAASGTTPLAAVLPAMTLIHMLIGIGEGLITIGALALVETVRPDLVSGRSRPAGASAAAFASIGLLVALIIALFSPLASPMPDGLDSVAESLQFAQQARAPLFDILPDYGLPFVNNATVSTIGAVALGTLVVFLAAFLLGRTAGRRSDARAS